WVPPPVVLGDVVARLDGGCQLFCVTAGPADRIPMDLMSDVDQPHTHRGMNNLRGNYNSTASCFSSRTGLEDGATIRATDRLMFDTKGRSENGLNQNVLCRARRVAPGFPIERQWYPQVFATTSV